ncbi:TPR domain-containing protein [Streptomyces luteocolor]|uniref:TPR domain-containing protein n=1 Tax=Streptomyces luteocolor TaxID=285500 RepID=UPI0008532D0C|nr:tetratricopeptide repeat protein [Streptomyces luteocolor]
MSLDQAAERAEGLVSLGRNDEAVELLGRRLAEEPDDVAAWEQLARCHLRADRPHQALEATERALRLTPENVNVLLVHAQALRLSGRGFDEAEAALRTAIRLSPHFWGSYSMLADLLFRRNIVRKGQEIGTGRIGTADIDAVAGEPRELVQEAIRLAPEEIGPYEKALFIADLSGDADTADAMERAILRLDPTHAEALSGQTRRAAEAPGVRAADAADLYADALAVAPESADMRDQLDAATYRMLRGTRWLALFCLALIAAGLDLFTTDGETPRELPLALGQRLWDLVPLTVIWLLGAALRFHRRRKGVRLNVRSLLRRDGWARLAAGQSAAVMVCTLLLTLVPWTERGLPTTLFWAALGTTLLTMWVDRPAVRKAFREGARRR